MKDLKFFIETMTFCQGNCQGCFFSKEERVSGNLMSSDNLSNILFNISTYIEKQRVDENEDFDITIVLGQGDHFSVENDALKYFMENLIVLKKYNPLIIFTTSALIKNDELLSKIKLIRQLSLDNGLRIIPAVVLDIKKFKHDGFSLKYQENLSLLRNEFGILDLVINLGQDTVDNFKPDIFVDFIEKNKIRHIEFNFVPTLQTMNLFKNNTWESIISWLSKVANMKKNTKIFHEYSFFEKIRSRDNDDKSFKYLMSILIDGFKSHIYIDKNSNVTPAGFGFVGNAVPYHNKNGNIKHIFVNDILKYEELSLSYAKNAIKNYMQDKNCSECEFLHVCVDSGVDTMRHLNINDKSDCNFNAKSLFKGIELSSFSLNQKPVDKDITNRDVTVMNDFGIDKDSNINF